MKKIIFIFAAPFLCSMTLFSCKPDQLVSPVPQKKELTDPVVTKIVTPQKNELSANEKATLIKSTLDGSITGTGKDTLTVDSVFNYQKWKPIIILNRDKKTVLFEREINTSKAFLSLPIIDYHELPALTNNYYISNSVTRNTSVLIIIGSETFIVPTKSVCSYIPNGIIPQGQYAGTDGITKIYIH